MYNPIRKWLKKKLSPSAVHFIRQEIVPWYREWMKLVWGFKKAKLAREAISHPDSAITQMDLGDALCQLGQTGEAIDCYEKAIERDPRLLRAHLQLERCIRFHGQEKVLDKKGNIIFDNRTYDIDESSLNRLLSCTKRMVEAFPDSVETNFRHGNALLMVAGSREEASRCFHQATKLRIAQWRAQGNLGPIFIASMHRSATGFLMRSLRDGLKMPRDIPEVTPCADWWYPEITIPVPSYALTTEAVFDSLSSGHTAALPQNLMVFNLCVDKLIVNVRDPREGLVSHIHYIKNYFRHTNNKEGLLEINIPKNYFKLSLTDQISWHIDNFYLPATLKWIQGWLEASENAAFYPKILFTTQEELVADSRGYFIKILKFYDIDETRFTFPKKPEFKKATTMRKGRVDEWREIFTPEQAQRATRMIPEKMFAKFGWSKDTSVFTKDR